MPWKKVEGYYVTANRGGNFDVFIKLEGDATLVQWNGLEGAHCMALVDVLRNEKPISYNTDREQLSTNLEPVGEGEG